MVETFMSSSSPVWNGRVLGWTENQLSALFKREKELISSFCKNNSTWFSFASLQVHNHAPIACLGRHNVNIEDDQCQVSARCQLHNDECQVPQESIKLKTFVDSMTTEMNPMDPNCFKLFNSLKVYHVPHTRARLHHYRSKPSYCAFIFHFISLIEIIGSRFMCNPPGRQLWLLLEEPHSPTR